MKRWEITWNDGDTGTDVEADTIAQAVASFFEGAPWRASELRDLTVKFVPSAFELLDGEKHAAAAPSTFQIPPRWARESLQVDDLVKLMFEFTTGVERMWVRVVQSEGGYVGRLANTPAIGDAQEGDEVSFDARHVIDIVMGG